MKRTRKSKVKTKKKVKRFKNLHPDFVEENNLENIEKEEFLEMTQNIISSSKGRDFSFVPDYYVDQTLSNFSNLQKNETFIIKDPVIIAKLENKFCEQKTTSPESGLNKIGATIEPRFDIILL